MVPTPREVVDVLRRAWALTPPDRAVGLPDEIEADEEAGPAQPDRARRLGGCPATARAGMGR